MQRLKAAKDDTSVNQIGEVLIPEAQVPNEEELKTIDAFHQGQPDIVIDDAEHEASHSENQEQSEAYEGSSSTSSFGAGVSEKQLMKILASFREKSLQEDI